MQGSFSLFFIALWPMLAAIICYLIGRKNKTARDLFADAAVIVEFTILLYLFVGKLGGKSDLEFILNDFCGMGLHLEFDGFRAVYGTVAAFMWMMTTVFSREYFTHYRNRNRYYMFMLMTLGATMGVFLSADLYTTFIFFEIMSFTSYVWVVHDEKEEAMRAGQTYLAVAVIGGLVMLMGLFMLYNEVGTLTLRELLPAISEYTGSSAKLYLIGALMVFGFGAKAGMFPLHIWLPKAHPVAPAPSSALLSGILTKSGVFGILAVTCNIFLHDSYWGFCILILGVITMFSGALLAIFSVDFKRTLACSSMSQIGFILIGVGMQCLLGHENVLAVGGTVLHMVNHSIIKLTLFMVAGVIYMNTHRLNLNEIRGFGRKKPLLMIAYLLGALSIGGIPLWSGYISKTLLHESIVEYMEGVITIGSEGLFKTIEWIFLISGGMTVSYMTKLFVAVFVEKNSNEEVQNAFDDKKFYMNTESVIAIMGSALVLQVMGLFPHATMDRLADLARDFMHSEKSEHVVSYFSLTNLKGAAISIAIGAIIYFAIIRTLLMSVDRDGNRIYVDRWPKWLDLENLIYRPIIVTILPTVLGFVSAIFCQITDMIIVLLRKTTHKQYATPFSNPENNMIAKRMGRLADRIRPKKDGTSHIPAYVKKQKEMGKVQIIISNSLSFGLILVCVGLILVVLYLQISAL